MTTADLRGDGREQVVVEWAPDGDVSGRIYELVVGPITALVQRATWTESFGRLNIIDLDIAVGNGLCGDSDPRPVLVEAYSSGSSIPPTARGASASARSIVWNPASQTFGFGLCNGFNSMTLSPPPHSEIQGGEIAVAVGDVANLLPTKVAPVPITAPTIAESGDGGIGAGTYRWAVAWVRSRPGGGGQLSALSAPADADGRGRQEGRGAPQRDRPCRAASP